MTGIYRITHYKNLPFIFENGLQCPDSEIQDPGFISIGFPSLIAYRNERPVPVAPYGTLADYVPFYFTVRSPMLYVIHLGNDPEVIKTPQEEIVYLVSTVEKLKELTLPFVFTNRHAQLDYAEFYNSTDDLDKLNWEIIKSSEWGRKYGPERKEIKQAECLIRDYLPVAALIGIGCMNREILDKVREMIFKAGIEIEIKVKENWYF
jgi:hypothetical protein